MNIEQTKNNLIETFDFLDSWEERYQYIIEQGKSLPLIDSKYKTNNFLIKGCQSQVWLHADFHDGKVFFTADSDAIITKGIIAILISVFSERTPEEILQSNTDFIDAIGLKEHLSPTRANGLVSMIEQIRQYAQAFQLIS